jgi:hypothetical protein
VLFEQAHGVIAKAGVEVIEFVRVGDVSPEFVNFSEDELTQK